MTQMIKVLAVFVVLILYDLQRFIRKKEKGVVFVLYFLFMGVSLAVSMLLAAGVKLPSPARWIESTLRMIGVIK